MTVQDRDIERALSRLAGEISPAAEEVDAAFAAFLDAAAEARHRRRWSRLVAACAAVVLLIAGVSIFGAGTRLLKGQLLPARPTTAHTSVISAEDLLGVWAMHADWLAVPGSLWTFQENGSGGFGNSANTLEDQIEYTLTGSRLSGRYVGGCGFAYRLASFRQGTLTAEVLEHCGNVGPGMSWVRLSPASPAGRAIPMPSMDGSVPARNPAQVAGVWLMPGTGLLVAIDASDAGHATYALDDQGDLTRSPRDTGTVTLTPDGTLTLTSTKATAPGCASGSPQVILRGARILPGQGLQATRGTTSTCPLAPVQANWIMVSAR